MPLSSSPRIDADEVDRTARRGAARACPTSSVRRAGCSRSARSSSTGPAAKRTRCSRRPACRPSGWCNAPRSSGPPRHAPARSSTPPRTTARRLKLETEDFLDQRLASFEILLDKLGKTVGAGRQKLSIGNAGDAPLRWTSIEDGRPRPRASSTRIGEAGACRRTRSPPAGQCPRTAAPCPASIRRDRGVGRRRPISVSTTIGSPARSGSISIAISTLDGVVVTGTIAMPWATAVPPLPGRRDGHVGRRGRGGLPGRRRATDDAFEIEGDQIDLAPAVREYVLIELPDGPLCRDDCAGICPVCGIDRNEAPCECDTTVRDERWVGPRRAPPRRGLIRCLGGGPNRAHGTFVLADAPIVWRSPFVRCTNHVLIISIAGVPPWLFPRRRSRSRRAAALARRPGGSTRRRAASAPVAATPSAARGVPDAAGRTRVASSSTSADPRLDAAHVAHCGRRNGWRSRPRRDRRRGPRRRSPPARRSCSSARPTWLNASTSVICR